MDKQQSYYKSFSMNKILNSDYWIGVFTGFSGWMVSFVLPVVPFISIVCFLVIADLYTGLSAARIQKKEIHSKGLRRTVEKITLYLIAILASEGVKQVFAPSVPITYITAFTIALTELKSNMENIEKVTGVNIWNQIKEVIIKKK